jgi:hypothetical protein
MSVVAATPNVCLDESADTSHEALADALEILGYNGVYHMREVGKNGHHAAWVELITAKIAGRGDQLTKSDFEHLLQNFEAGVLFSQMLTRTLEQSERR